MSRLARQVPARTRQVYGGLLLLAAALVIAAAPASAQSPRCVVFCAPELKIEPTFTIENLGRRARVDAAGVVERQARETVFELIFALDVPTTVPRVGFTLEAIFVPFGETSTHPFTGATKEATGRDIRDNGIEIEAELNIDLIDEDRTGGWVSSHFDIVDKFSPGETPRAASVYTHKLNFEWDTAFHVFNKLPDRNWLRHVEAELSVDYLATGLPKRGDIVSGERFLDDASPWSLSFVFVFPLAPLNP